MAQTVGYVGTIESETRGVARLWFSLTSASNNASWVKMGANRAWFTMNMTTDDRPAHMAQLTLLLEALRSGLQVQVSHGGAVDFHKQLDGDTFEVDGIRILRGDLNF